MMTIQDLMEARENDGASMMISVARARRIVQVDHGLSDPAEFDGFLGLDHMPGKRVCAASVYEWLGY